MGKWYFTFGGKQPNEGMCQPIIAPSFGAARQKMFELHGERWAFQYGEDQWNSWKNDPTRYWPMESELPTIEVLEATADD